MTSPGKLPCFRSLLSQFAILIAIVKSFLQCFKTSEFIRSAASAISIISIELLACGVGFSHEVSKLGRDLSSLTLVSHYAGTHSVESGYPNAPCGM